MKTLLGATSILALFALFILCPFLLIWGLNELAEQGGLTLQFPYNIWTYLASLSISFVLKGSGSSD